MSSTHPVGRFKLLRRKPEYLSEVVQERSDTCPMLVPLHRPNLLAALSLLSPPFLVLLKVPLILSEAPLEPFSFFLIPLCPSAPCVGGFFSGRVCSHALFMFTPGSFLPYLLAKTSLTGSVHDLASVQADGGHLCWPPTDAVCRPLSGLPSLRLELVRRYSTFSGFLLDSFVFGFLCVVWHSR